MNSAQMQKIDALRAAGRSYREISDALHIPVSTIKSYCSRPEKPPKPKPSVSKVCLYCGAALNPKSKTRPARFCNNRCYRLWWQEHSKKPRTVYEKVCAGCGKPFSVASKKTQKYCSYECFRSAGKAGANHA